MTKPIAEKAIDTPYDRYQELMRTKGIGEVGARKIIFDESKWWNGKKYSIQVRDLVYNCGLSNHSVLAIAYYVQEHFSDELIQYRIKNGKYDECIINPWVIMREIPYYDLDCADKLARYQSLDLDSPDRISEILYNAIDKVMKNGGDTFTTDIKVKNIFNALTNNVYKNTRDVYIQAMADLRAQKRVVTF